MVKTKVKNWAVVHIKDDLSPFRILWAIIKHDERISSLKSGDYLCSSRVLYIKDNIVRTHTGSAYELVGLGAEYSASYGELIQLMEGHSPTELNLEVK
ncbi:MAG: hypothetical protein ACJAS1_005144 [Oleiphilaceae bacterium]|jgi:hypothetical protein